MVAPRIAVSVGAALLQDDMIMAVILGGVDLFRIQQVKFSFEESVAYARRVKAIAAQLRKPVSVMFDYSGQREHIGKLEKELKLLPGEMVRFVRSGNGATKETIPVSLPDDLWRKLKPDERMYLADGIIQVRIHSITEQDISAIVEVATDALKTDDDINFPDSDYRMNPIDARERTDLPKLAALGIVDWISLSFVEEAQPIREARMLLGDGIKIMAKVESQHGVERIDKIAEEADGIMVARGDLAIQAPMERLGIYERLIVQAARKADKPVMLATQFLESMVQQPIPLRAELSDVATAALLGVDWILLTKEVAKGAYPLRALAIAKGTLEYTAQHAAEVQKTGF